MPAGFQVWGDHGFMQIDDSYSNLALVAKGTVQSPGSSVNKPCVDVVVSVINPIIALSSPRCHAFVLGNKNNGDGTWTFRIAFAYGEAPAAVIYYVFGQPSNQGGHFGIQVLRPDGAIAFDSTLTYFNLRGVIDSHSDNHDNTPAFTANPGGSYGWLMGDPGVSFTQVVDSSVPQNTIVINTFRPWSIQGGDAALHMDVVIWDITAEPYIGTTGALSQYNERPKSILLVSLDNL